MKFVPTPLTDAYIVELDLLRDDRGGFARTYCKKEFEQIGHTREFVQFNHSFNTQKGTLRGMHFQAPPHAEVKLIRCIAGSVYDVIVDVRAGSSTFLQWFGTELSRENKRMFYVPEGFAHGFLTLTDHTELLYHHSCYYTPEADRGVRFDDPLLGIQWPGQPEVISDKDKRYPLLGSDFNGLNIFK
jgi:dTDP-4-dehydrorhamnose 3,5-epimerase